jgi:hypothetical protein
VLGIGGDDTPDLRLVTPHLYPGPGPGPVRARNQIRTDQKWAPNRPQIGPGPGPGYGGFTNRRSGSIVTTTTRTTAATSISIKSAV